MAIADNHFKKPPESSGVEEAVLPSEPFQWPEVNIDPQLIAMGAAAICGAIFVMVALRKLRRKPQIEE